ncbi:MAG: GTP-binding protein [Candidatus Hermodarchaeota archaeon]
MSSFKLKVLLIEAERAGMARLIQKLVRNRFQTNYKLTVGVDILTKEVEFRPGETATLSIWDIGDQQRFEFIRSTFYKGAAGALLVFDFTREPSYDEIKKWFIEIKKFAGSIPFVLIGNVSQLFKLMNKKILRKEAHEFAREEGGIYIETSPMSIDVIEGAVQKLTREIIESR